MSRTASGVALFETEAIRRGWFVNCNTWSCYQVCWQVLARACRASTVCTPTMRLDRRQCSEHKAVPWDKTIVDCHDLRRMIMTA